MSEATAIKGGKMSSARNLRPSSRSTELDGDLVARVAGRLRKSGYPALRRVSCESHEGVLVLRGHVPSYYLKQVAQELVRGVEGAEMILNKVEVCARQASS